MKYILIFFLFIPILTFSQDGHCKAIKKDGTQCKAKGNFVSKTTGYCHTHDPKTARCGVIKKDGKPCKMVVKKAGTACKFHSTEH